MRGVRRIRPGETFEVCGAGKTLDLIVEGEGRGLDFEGEFLAGRTAGTAAKGRGNSWGW